MELLNKIGYLGKNFLKDIHEFIKKINVILILKSKTHSFYELSVWRQCVFTFIMSKHKDIELNIVYKNYNAICFIVFSYD